jgi:hypothetical protein
MLLGVTGLLLVLGLAATSTPSDSSSAAPVINPAQPQAVYVLRGTRCDAPGATASDEHGIAVDCEPFPDGHAYWIIA